MWFPGSVGFVASIIGALMAAAVLSIPCCFSRVTQGLSGDSRGVYRGLCPKP